MANRVPTPTPEDKFSFGLWTVSWAARDPFGDATRPALDPSEAVANLAELGAWGITFHDDDVVPFGADDASRTAHLQKFRDACDQHKITIEMVNAGLRCPPDVGPHT